MWVPLQSVWVIDSQVLRVTCGSSATSTVAKIGIPIGPAGLQWTGHRVLLIVCRLSRVKLECSETCSKMSVLVGMSHRGATLPGVHRAACRLLYTRVSRWGMERVLPPVLMRVSQLWWIRMRHSAPGDSIYISSWTGETWQKLSLFTNFKLIVMVILSRTCFYLWNLVFKWTISSTINGAWNWSVSFRLTMEEGPGPSVESSQPVPHGD